MVVGVNGTAGIWATYPQEFVTTPTALGDQVNDEKKTTCTFCLLLIFSPMDNLFQWSKFLYQNND